jgi:hypothetical protein
LYIVIMGADYKLIQSKIGSKQCVEHTVEKLVDLYNSPKWKMQVVDVDKIQFICKFCKSERVYKLKPERTLL